jgi:hypothetical protein
MTIELLERPELETVRPEVITVPREELTKTKANWLLLNAEKAWLRYLRNQNEKNQMAHLKAVRHLHANGLVQYDSYQIYNGRKETGIPIPTWKILNSLPE